MDENLVVCGRCDFIEVAVRGNVIEIKLDIDKLDCLSLFIILFSYVRFRYFIVEKILLTYKNSNEFFYRNINFIQNFSYIDFKIWWSRIQNINYSVADTKLYLSHEVEFYSFIIHVEESSMNYCVKKFENISHFYPRIPLKNNKIISEIFGESEIEMFKDFKENAKK